jgi:hypothetical protein
MTINWGAILELFEVLLCGFTGLFLLASLVRGEASGSVLIAAFHAAYGLAFVAGAAAFYLKPVLGALLLLAALVSVIPVSATVGLSIWADASSAGKAGMILGLILASGIVARPLYSDEI